MRRGWTTGSVVAAALIALTASGCSMGTSSAGSCAVKEIALTDSALHPGGTVQLSVDWMWATCEDTGGTSRAATNIAVAITSKSSDREYPLGTVDVASGPRFTVSGRFDLPRDLPPGDATLTVTSPVGNRVSATLPVKISAA